MSEYEIESSVQVVMVNISAAISTFLHLFPFRIWIRRKICVEIARIPRHFLANPVRFIKALVLVFQLDFGHDEPVIVSGKHVHLPDKSCVLDPIPQFFYEGLQAEPVEECIGIVNGDFIFVFQEFQPMKESKTKWVEFLKRHFPN